MSEIEQPRTFSRLDIGVLIVLVTMAIAGVVGLIAVLDANSDVAAVGVGFGVAYVIFFAGGTIACALACLARRRLEALSLGALVASGLGVDLLVLAFWLDIDSEAYVKLAGIAFVATVFGLIVLGLSLACRPQDSLARTLYLCAVGASLVGAALAALLVLTTGGEDFGPTVAAVPVPLGNGDLLRSLAATLVALAALWLAALAASRVERPADG